GRAPGVAPRRRARRRVGRRARGRGRAHLGGSRRRRNAPAGGRRGQTADAALDPAASRRGCTGRIALRPDARVPQRPCERSRPRLALSDLRVPRHGLRLSRGGRRRGGPAQARDLGRIRLVVPRDHWRRFVAPAAFLLAATIAVLLIRSGLRAGTPTPTTTVVVPTTRHKTVAGSTTTTTRRKKAGTPSGQRFWTVQAGDTF